MSTADKLTYLNNTKSLLKDRLNSLGAEITSSTTFRNYLTWLDTFYEDASDKTDLSVNGVVGRTSQESTIGKNLCKINAITSKGITSTYDASTGVITYSGTTNQSYPWFSDASIDTIPTGTILTASLTTPRTYNTYIRLYDIDNNYKQIIISAGQTSGTITTDRDVVRIVILDNTPTNTTISGTLQVQLELGSNATDFEKFSYGASPNPDFSQSINNLSGDVSYKVSGKNLLNKADGTYDGWVVADISDLIEDGVNYYVSIDYKNLIGSCTICIDYTYNGTANYIWGEGGSDGTVTEGTMYKLFSIPNHDPNTIIRIVVKDAGVSLTSGYYSNWLLAKSNTATLYEPYIEPQTFTIPLGDIELCNIDTYEDKIYSSNGRFYLEKKNSKVILNGSENWYFQNSAIVTSSISDVKQSTNNSEKLVLSNYYLGATNNYRDGIPNGGIAKVLGANTQIGIKDRDYSVIGDFTTWLASHNMDLYYVLSIPTTTEITQENYPALYNALKQIQDYLTAYKINKEFILGYSSPEIEY